MNLPSTIFLKQNMLVELIGGNYGTEDNVLMVHKEFLNTI